MINGGGQVQRGKDGKLYRWNDQENKWEEVPEGEEGQPADPNNPGAVEAPPMDAGDVGNGYGNMYDPSLQNLNDPNLPTANYMDPAYMEWWAANQQAMLNPQLYGNPAPGIPINETLPGQ
jgi:hypothetical protein